jgi:hypothetical protein
VTNPQGASGQAPGRATNAGGQAPSPNDSLAGQAPTQANNEAHDLDDVPPERLRKMVDDLRKSEAAHRTENKDLKQWKEQAESAKLSELEKATQEHAKLQEEHAQATTELQRLRVERVVDREAARLGIDPDDAARLIDWSDLEYDNDGKPKNAGKLLEALVKQKPYLVTGSPTASSAQQSQSQQNGNRQTAGGATNPRMNHASTGDEPMSAAVYQRLMTDPAEYMRRRDEAMAWRARQR